MCTITHVQSDLTRQAGQDRLAAETWQRGSPERLSFRIAARRTAAVMERGAQAGLCLLDWRKRVRVERTIDVKDANRRF